jgi:nucleoid-associated protein YgaU
VTETPETTWESVENPSDPSAGPDAASEDNHLVEEEPSQDPDPAELGAKKVGEGEESEGRTEPETAGPDQVDIPEETIGSKARSVEPAPQSQTDPAYVEQEEDEGQIVPRFVVEEECDTRELVTGAFPTQARLRDLRDKSAGEILKEAGINKESAASRTIVEASRPVPSGGRVRRWAAGATLLVLLLIGLLVGYRASGPDLPEIGEMDQMAVLQPKELKPENMPAAVLTPPENADLAPSKEVMELPEEISPAKKREASAEAVQPPESPREEAGALPDTTVIREEAPISPTQTPTTGFLFYTVVKGDILWDVSDRFTQSGFNYQTLAGDSGIEDPNLIEPGQIVWIRMDLIPPGMLSDKSLLDRPDAAGPASGQEHPDLLLEVDRESGAIIVKEVTGEIPFAHVRHLVVKGDTLWHIAERYTGDPFKYPVLAEASRIENPDLIFPRQTIFIRMASSP